MVHSLPSTSPTHSHTSSPSPHEVHEEDTGVLSKQIKSLADIDAFQLSPTYSSFLGFILDLNESVIGKPLSFQCEVSKVYYYIIIFIILPFPVIISDSVRYIIYYPIFHPVVALFLFIIVTTIYTTSIIK